MARALAAASSQYLRTTTIPAAVMPLTIACWWKPVATGLTYAVIDCSDAAGNNLFQLQVRSTNVVRLNHATGGGQSNADTVATVTTNWNHITGVFANSTSRSIYLNGTGKVTDTSSRADPGAMAAFVLGKFESSGGYADGLMAEVAVWNVALDDAEIAALAAAFSPSLIRPASLVAYWPLWGNDSQELDRSKNANSLTLTNGPTKADHPRMYQRSRPNNIGYGPPAAAAAAPAQGNMLLVF